ncbi:TetR/AcrR family transcriptional regulator [Desulfobacter sp.]|uniref:TetR/AcrR family transcriptional regulator n=1 Tax=Desulfobacter sp. TaxID=2294 RepID=UPI000E882FAC|nr:TetR/AcrR family transcriptional regulator [Desulfobacter sp.]HBT87434.1 TetR family transcriptional regulator [Desulfobacter sp.]
MQKRKSHKYHNILNSAGAVFAEHGFYKATISQIAARAGVADGTLYLYFKNKDDILYQYLSFKTDVVFEKMNAAVAKGTDAESKLRNLIRCHLEEFQRDKNMAIIFQSEVRYLRDIESQVKDISKMYFDLLSDIIEQGQVEGTMRQDLFVGLVKRFILGAVEGVISTWVSADGRYDLTTMAEPLVDLYMTGVRGG